MADATPFNGAGDLPEGFQPSFTCVEAGLLSVHNEIRGQPLRSKIGLLTHADSKPQLRTSSLNAPLAKRLASVAPPPIVERCLGHDAVAKIQESDQTTAPGRRASHLSTIRESKKKPLDCPHRPIPGQRGLGDPAQGSAIINLGLPWLLGK